MNTFFKSLAITLTATTLFSGTQIVNAQNDRSESNTTPLPSIFQEREERRTTKHQKPRIAVLNFDYSSVSSPYLLQLTQSRGVSDILVNRLVKTDKYRIIERSQIEAVLVEQNIGVSGRIDSKTAAKIGELLGVKYLLYGSVTQFNIETKKGGIRVFGIGNRTKDSIATVQLNLRVVETKTGEILGVAEATSNSTSKDDAINIFGIATATDTSNEAKLLSTATVGAIDDLVEQLAGQI